MYGLAFLVEAVEFGQGNYSTLSKKTHIYCLIFWIELVW